MTNLTQKDFKQEDLPATLRFGGKEMDGILNMRFGEVHTKLHAGNFTDQQKLVTLFLMIGMIETIEENSKLILDLLNNNHAT